jgi:predicted small metal-binding protein
MASQISCECGYVARGGTDDEVVRLIRVHISTDHPELLDTITPDVLREWVEVVG